MNFKSIAIVIGIVTAVMLGEANLANAQGIGFGTRGTTFRVGISRGQNNARRYSRPSFFAAPRFNRSYRPAASQYQLRQWSYSRSGVIEYYRPYNPQYGR